MHVGHVGRIGGWLRNRLRAGDWLIFPPIRRLASDYGWSAAVHSTGKSVPVPLGARGQLHWVLQPRQCCNLGAAYMSQVRVGASKDDLQALLRPHGQEHLLRFWDRLSPDRRARLADQIRLIDFARLAGLRAGEQSGIDWHALAARAQPPKAVRLAGEPPNSADEARQRGRQSLAEGHWGVVLVAGGQGTRLGFDHPKGMYPIGPVSNATLFQILLEKVKAVSAKFSVRVPLAIMTSPATHDETAQFLDQHGRFGVLGEDVRLFCQGTMPAVEFATGKVLLSAEDEIATSPDGHGGMLAAMRSSGILDELHNRGIEQIFYHQVDNPLVATLDPEFIGYHLLAGSELSTQVVAKRTALDRVGNVVSVDGVLQVIEYSDLPEESARRTGPDGSLLLWAGNTAVHAMSLGLLARMSTTQRQLPFHLARKKVPYLDDEGRLAEPAEPNAIKFEQFIFDLLPEAKKAIVIEVREEEAFAPLKNAAGAATDSPEIVRRQMVAQAGRWLASQDVCVAEGVAVEISPLYALDAADLAGKLPRGTVLSKATWLRPEGE